MLLIEYFILINLLYLTVRHVNTLPWYKRVHGHTDRFHENSEYCGKISLLILNNFMQLRM